MKRVAAFMCWQGDTDATRWSTGLSSDLLVPSHRDCDSGSDIAASGGASYRHHFLVKLVLRLEGSGLTTSTRCFGILARLKQQMVDLFSIGPSATCLVIVMKSNEQKMSFRPMLPAVQSYP